MSAVSLAVKAEVARSYFAELSKRGAFGLCVGLLVATFIVGGLLLDEPAGYYVLAALVAVIGGYGGWRIASRVLD